MRNLFSWLSWLVKYRQWAGLADWLGHVFRLPHVMQDRLCDMWDRKLGLTDEEIDRTGPE